MRILFFSLPFIIFIGLFVFLGLGLSHDPKIVPSPLINKPLPEFSLSTVGNAEKILSKSDFMGNVTLLNVWASWCISCRYEHPALIEIAKHSNIKIYGLNWKDTRESASQWLAEFGNPYIASAYDMNGRVGIDLGVYGAPETFIIDSQGKIIYKHIGPITAQIWRDVLQPVIHKANNAR